MLCHWPAKPILVKPWIWTLEGSKKTSKVHKRHRKLLPFYQGSNLCLRGYTDADYGGDLDECISTSGYVFLLDNGAISWRSKKQTCIALSTMEAKFIACSAGVQEAIWLRQFLENLGVRD